MATIRLNDPRRPSTPGIGPREAEMLYRQPSAVTNAHEQASFHDPSFRTIPYPCNIHGLEHHQQPADMLIDFNPVSANTCTVVQYPTVLAISEHYPHIRYQPQSREFYGEYAVPVEPRLLIRPRFPVAPSDHRWPHFYPPPRAYYGSLERERYEAMQGSGVNYPFLAREDSQDEFRSHTCHTAEVHIQTDSSEPEIGGSAIEGYPGLISPPENKAVSYDVQVSPTGQSQPIISHTKKSSQSGGQTKRQKRRGRRASHQQATRNVGEKLYPCPMCGKEYCRKSTLKAHLRQHSGERPYICQICGKSFSQAANLTAHRRVHTGEKPFTCPICCRPFSQSSSLVTHKRTHTGERPYACNLCQKAFTDSSTLTKHLRTHTGHKPYQCSECQLSFSQSGNLNRHMKTHRQ